MDPKPGRDDETADARRPGQGAGSGLIRIERLPIAALETNRLSANVQDSSTYARLLKALEKWGMVELPVVVEAGGGHRMIAGHHRVRAWADLGHEDVDCIVIPSGAVASREAEFNLVNELNRVRGQTSDADLLRIVRREALEAEAVDVHGLAKELLHPRIDPEDLQPLDDAARRRVRVLELTNRVAKEIASTMVDERDELVTVIVVEDKMAAVLRLPMRSTRASRVAASVLRDPLRTLVEQVLSEAGDEVGPDAGTEPQPPEELHAHPSPSPLLYPSLSRPENKKPRHRKSKKEP